MRNLLCRIVPVFAILLVGAQAQAAFVFNVTNPTGPTTFSSPSGLTTFTLTPNSPQTFQASSNVNVFNITSSSTATTAESYSFNFTETFTLTNSDGRVGTFTFTGTLNVVSAQMGAILSNVSNTMVTPTAAGANGFSASFQGYAAPSPASSGTSGSQGNLSLQVLAPAAVPEPASVLLLGLGLVGTAGFAARRRLA